MGFSTRAKEKQKKLLIATSICARGERISVTKPELDLPLLSKARRRQNVQRSSETLSIGNFQSVSLALIVVAISSWDGRKICSFVQTSGDESLDKNGKEEEEELKPPEDSLVVCSFINGILRDR